MVDVTGNWTASENLEPVLCWHKSTVGSGISHGPIARLGQMAGATAAAQKWNPAAFA